MPPRTSPRKRASASAVTAVKPEKAAIEKRPDKVNGAVKKAKSKVETATKTKAKAPATTTSRKRKTVKEEDTDQEDAEEDHECDSHGEEADEVKKPAPKKRKTKKDKEKDMAPLAERTAVSSLKKAMYIGAHVSGAGGTLPSLLSISKQSAYFI